MYAWALTMGDETWHVVERDGVTLCGQAISLEDSAIIVGGSPPKGKHCSTCLDKRAAR